MRKFLLLVATLMLAMPVFAQYTAVTGTVVDGSNVPYVNGYYQIDYKQPSTGCTGVPIAFQNAPGVNVQSSYSGRLNGAGVIPAMNLPDNAYMACSTSKWTYSICNQTRNICFSADETITGASQSVSADLKTAATTLTTAFIATGTANPSTSGVIRLATTDTIGWRNAANGGNVTLSDAGAAAAGTGNIADLLLHAAGWQGAAFVDTSAAPSQAGVVRTGNNTTAVSARNAADSGNVALLASNTSNQAVLAAAKLTASTTTVASMVVPAGTAPTTSVAGDLWNDSTRKAFALAPIATAVTYADSTISAAYTTTAQATANVNTAQALTETAIPAALLNVGNKTLVVKGAGVYSLGAGSTVAFAVKVCTVSGCGSGTVVAPCTWTTGSNANTSVVSSFNFECVVGTLTTGATGTLLGHGVAAIEVGASNVTAATVFGDVTTAATAAVDLTAADFLETMVTFGTANASNTATLQTLVVTLRN